MRQPWQALSLLLLLGSNLVVAIPAAEPAAAEPVPEMPRAIHIKDAIALADREAATPVSDISSPEERDVSEKREDDAFYYGVCANGICTFYYTGSAFPAFCNCDRGYCGIQYGVCFWNNYGGYCTC